MLRWRQRKNVCTADDDSVIVFSRCFSRYRGVPCCEKYVSDRVLVVFALLSHCPRDGQVRQKGQVRAVRAGEAPRPLGQFGFRPRETVPAVVRGRVRQAELVLPVGHGIPTDVAARKVALPEGDRQFGRPAGQTAEGPDETPRSQGCAAAVAHLGVSGAQTDDRVRSRAVAAQGRDRLATGSACSRVS